MQLRFSILFATPQLAGCSGPAREDEARLRADFGIPPQVALSSLAATPKSAGWFGREGLRVVGRFQLSAQQVREAESTWLRAPRWQPLPLPGAISTLRPPPEDLLGHGGAPGLYQCFVGVWRTGQSFAPYPCSAPPPKFDEYRVAVFVPQRGEIVAVAKNYY